VQLISCCFGGVIEVRSGDAEEKVAADLSTTLFFFIYRRTNTNHSLAAVAAIAAVTAIAAYTAADTTYQHS